jgi:hypothetical protein
MDIESGIFLSDLNIFANEFLNPPPPAAARELRREEDPAEEEEAVVDELELELEFAMLVLLALEFVFVVLVLMSCCWSPPSLELVSSLDEDILRRQKKEMRQNWQYNTIQYKTKQYNTIQCNAMQCNTMQCNTIQYNTIQCDANTIQEHEKAGITKTLNVHNDFFALVLEVEDNFL